MDNSSIGKKGEAEFISIDENWKIDLVAGE
jgi:hypothetical protein